jgi:hypothetical protein
MTPGLTRKDHTFKFDGRDIAAAAAARAAELVHQQVQLRRRIRELKQEIVAAVGEVVDKMIDDDSRYGLIYASDDGAVSFRTDEGATAETPVRVNGQLWRDLFQARGELREVESRIVRYRSEAATYASQNLDFFELNADDVRYFGLDREQPAEIAA